MKDNVRQELKELCYFIIENNNALSRPEQLTRVQMLYERLLVLNYMEEMEADGKVQASQLKVDFVNPQPENTSPASNPDSSQGQVHLESKLTKTPATEEIKAEIKEAEAQIIERKQSLENRPGLNDNAEAPKSINDELAKGAIQVGLNDRIAFVKHLFNDSQEDFNRVLSQLNTLDTYLESMYFVENLVKPDYNWEDKKPYEDRLIALIKKRFGEDW